MSTKHTPGPWTIEAHGDAEVLYSGRTDGQHGLNLVYLKEPDWNWAANKRLIAAAPDLLAAVKILLDPKAGDVEARIAQAVIDKAEGRT